MCANMNACMHAHMTIYMHAAYIAECGRASSRVCLTTIRPDFTGVRKSATSFVLVMSTFIITLYINTQYMIAT